MGEEKPETVDLAKTEFDRLMGGGGYAAFRSEEGGGTQIREFDADAEEIVLTPPLVGG